MRKAIVVLGLGCLVAAPALAGGKGWTIVGPPLEVRAMAIDPQNSKTLYTGGFQSFARSDDGGATWTVTSVPGLTLPSAVRVAFSIPSTIYMLGVGGLYRSTTAGVTWGQRTVASYGQSPSDLQVDARNADTLVLAARNLCLFGCSGGGVYRSTNGGGSWRGAGLKDRDIEHVALDPMSSQVMYATAGSILYRTGNGGDSWQNISPLGSGEIESVVVDHVVPTTVYAATHAGIFRSLDSGRSWTLVRGAVYGSMVEATRDGSRWLFGTAGGSALSVDGGESWQELSTLGSGFAFNSLWQVAVSRDAVYLVTDLVGAPGQILAYELRQTHRRAASGR